MERKQPPTTNRCPVCGRTRTAYENTYAEGFTKPCYDCHRKIVQELCGLGISKMTANAMVGTGKILRWEDFAKFDSQSWVGTRSIGKAGRTQIEAALALYQKQQGDEPEHALVEWNSPMFIAGNSMHFITMDALPPVKATKTIHTPRNPKTGKFGKERIRYYLDGDTREFLNEGQLLDAWEQKQTGAIRMIDRCPHCGGDLNDDEGGAA